MLMLPITHPACRGRSLAGEIQYLDYSALLTPLIRHFVRHVSSAVQLSSLTVL